MYKLLALRASSDTSSTSSSDSLNLTSLNVFTTKYTHSCALIQFIRNTKQFTTIITSKHALRSLEKLRQPQLDHDTMKYTTKDLNLLLLIKNHPLFVIGQASMLLASELGYQDIHGHTSTSAASLFNLIQKEYTHPSSSSIKTNTTTSTPTSINTSGKYASFNDDRADPMFLYLGGDKSLSTLSTMFYEAKMKLNQFIVYETEPIKDVDIVVQEAIYKLIRLDHDASHDTGGCNNGSLNSTSMPTTITITSTLIPNARLRTKSYPTLWILYTSPSTIEVTLQTIIDIKRLGVTIKFASIGPTTSRCLEDRGLIVNIESDLPSIERLCLLISLFEKDKR